MVTHPVTVIGAATTIPVRKYVLIFEKKPGFKFTFFSLFFAIISLYHKITFEKNYYKIEKNESNKKRY